MEVRLASYVPEDEIIAIGNRENLIRTFGSMVGVAAISFVPAVYLFGVFGKEFEPNLTLTFVLAVYSSVLIIYKFLYVERSVNDLDPVRRFHFADLIKLGFNLVFFLSATERFLFILVNGGTCVSIVSDGGGVGLSIAGNPLFRFVHCVGRNFWENFSGGDLVFLIVLCGLATFALESLRIVTENSAYSEDRVLSQNELIKVRVAALKRILCERSYDVRFFPQQVREPLELTPKNAQLPASDATHAKFQMKDFRQRLVWWEIVYALGFLLVVLAVSLICGMVIFHLDDRLPKNLSLLLGMETGLFSEALLIAYVSAMCAAEASSSAGKFLAILSALFFGVFGIAGLALFTLTASFTWLFLSIPLVTVLVLWCLLYVDSFIKCRRSGRGVNVKVEKPESFSGVDRSEPLTEAKEGQKYLWSLILQIEAEEKDSKSLRRLFKEVVSLGCIRELFRHNELLWTLQDVDLAVRNYLAFSRELPKPAQADENNEEPLQEVLF